MSTTSETPATEQPMQHQHQHQGGAMHPSEQPSIHHKGREKVPWSKEVWEAIDRHVHEEFARTNIGHKFIPHRRVHPKTTSVPAETITFEALPDDAPLVGATNSLTIVVDEGNNIRVIELWGEFGMTGQQVHETGESHELAHTTAVTLAMRTAQYVALAVDYVIFEGANAFLTPFFANFVRFRPGQVPLDTGLLSIVAPTTPVPGFTPATQVIPVFLAPGVTLPPAGLASGLLYGPNTFFAVAQAYSLLEQVGHNGPFALILQTTPFADVFAPVADLTLTADRIKPLVEAGLYGSGTLYGVPTPSTTLTLPAGTAITPALLPTTIFTGILCDIGGDSMDLVVGLPPITSFSQEDPDGTWRFRITTRFAFRLKDPLCAVRLEFQNIPAP